MAKRLEGKPFHLVAAHNQRNTKENVVAYIKSKGLAADTPNVTVTSFGNHPKVKGNGYVPYYMVFDQHGDLVRQHMCGDYHGGDGLKMIEIVDDLLKNASAIYLGKEPFRVVPKLAAAVGKKKKLPASILKIEKRLREATGDEKAELVRLQTAIESYRQHALEKIDRLLAKNPGTVLSSLQALQKDFRETPGAADIDAKLKEMRASKDLKTAIALHKSLRKTLSRLEKMKQPTPKARRKAAAKLEKLIADHGDLPIAEMIRQVIDDLK